MFRVLLFTMVFSVAALRSGEFSLELSDDQRDTICEVVTAFGEEQDLMGAAPRLIPLVMGILQISPLQIMAYVMSEENLRDSMLVASTNPFKWGIFMQGFNAKMEQEMQQDDIGETICSFADYVSLDQDRLGNLFEKKAWNDFALYALNN